MSPTTIADELRVISERVARIPDRYRQFTEPAARAQRYYRIPAETLTLLLDLGLPHGGDESGPTFDTNDLKSVSMALRVRSPQRNALKSMAEALIAGETPGHIERTVSLQAHCPHPGHEGLCRFALAPEVGASPDTADTARVDARHFEIEVRVPGGGARFVRFTPAEAQLVAEVSELRFHRIPYVLNLDLGFLAETGLADCRLATRFLARRGRELGVEIREATGLFLSRPFSPRHYWVQLRRGDNWVTADPFFLTALARWELLDPTAWPAHRSPRGAFWQVDIYPDAPLVTHLGGSPISILTR